MAVLELDVREAIDWVKERFDIPTCRDRITSNAMGTAHYTWADYSPRARAKRLIPDIKTMRNASAWSALSHCARLIAQLLLEIIPTDILTITTTQEKLRKLAGIGNRKTMKKALDQVIATGMIAMERSISTRDPISGMFTSDLIIRLTWGTQEFQSWLVSPRDPHSTATQSSCTYPVHGEAPKVNTVKSAFGSKWTCPHF